METWFRSPGGPEIPMISTRPAGESHGLYFGLLTLQPFVYLENTTPVTLMTSSPITANAWTHMVFSFDGSKTTLYVNGAAKASGTATLSNPRTYTQAYLGNDPTNNEWFTGDISVVRFYSRGLSADEVLLNCNALKGRFQGAVCAP